MIRLGFHLSIAGSVCNAPKLAGCKGYGAFQMFTTSSRSWKNSDISADDASEFRRCVENGGSVPFAHIPYLCNPSSTNMSMYEKSKAMLINNINNCQALGIEYLVIHIGSHLGKGIRYGIDNVCGALEEAIDSTENGVMVLLENGAGYRNSVGSKFPEIAKIMDRVDSDRVGFCFDTCHAFAAGYDMRDNSSVDSTVEELKSSIKHSKLKLVHLNDAKHQLGSGKDRHEHIGKGCIGREGFASIFSNSLFAKGSFVMELPEDSVGNHDTDMEAVKGILEEIRQR